jgi:ABC-2 type transport system permease protein
MKRFLVFVRKEFLHIFRDARTLVILFLIPAALLLLFGFVISTDLKNARVSFLDLSNDEMTQQIANKIYSSGFFEKGEPVKSYSDIGKVLRGSSTKAVIIFEKDFARKLVSEGKATVNIITDGSEPNTASMATTYISGIITDYNRQMAGPNASRMFLIQPEIRMFYNPALKAQHMFVPGVITLIMILVCALMTSITITREKEFGTMEALLVSPLKPIQIILGKIMPYFILSIVDVIMILILSTYVFELPIKGSIALLLGESMLYILMSLSIGILISTVSKTMQQAIFISLVGMMLPTVLLSGFIFPIENMPVFYHWLSAALPPRYFVTILKNVMIKGTGFSFIWKETLILTGFTLLSIIISMKKFKIRLQ